MTKTKQEIAERAIKKRLLKEESIYGILDFTLCCYRQLLIDGYEFDENLDEDVLEPYVTYGLQSIQDGKDKDEDVVKHYREMSCNVIFAIAEHLRGVNYADGTI